MSSSQLANLGHERSSEHLWLERFIREHCQLEALSELLAGGGERLASACDLSDPAAIPGKERDSEHP